MTSVTFLTNFLSLSFDEVPYDVQTQAKDLKSIYVLDNHLILMTPSPEITRENI